MGPSEAHAHTRQRPQLYTKKRKISGTFIHLKGAYSYDAISEIRNRLVFIVSVLTILPWVLFTLRIEEEECAAEKEAKDGERGQLINPSKACRVEVIVQVEK